MKHAYLTNSSLGKMLGTTLTVFGPSGSSALLLSDEPESDCLTLDPKGINLLLYKENQDLQKIIKQKEEIAFETFKSYQISKKSLQSTIENLEKETKKHEKQISKLKETVKNSTELHSELQEEILNREELLDAYDKDWDAVQRELSDYREKLHALLSIVEDLEKDKEDQEGRNLSTWRDMTAMSNQIQSLREENEQLKENAELLEGQSDNYRFLYEAMDKDNKEMEKLLKEKSEERAKLEGELEDRDKNIKTLRENLRTIATYYSPRITRLTAENTVLKEELQDARACFKVAKDVGEEACRSLTEQELENKIATLVTM